MELKQLYDLIEVHLDNEILNPQEKMGKLKRVKLPIPEEYGGGFVTGYGWENTVRNLILKVSDQIKMESKAPTFKNSWEKWIEIKEGQLRSPSTIANYRYVAETHLIPFFGDKAIDQITPDDIQSFFNSIMHLSKSMSNQCKAILSGIFNRAVRMGDVRQNIMLYQYERSRKVGDKIVLQDEDLLKVIAQGEALRDAEDGRDYLYFCFLCFTALRRGEILGLKWKDIDFDKGEIRVRTNVIFPNGQNNPIVKEPKDESFGTVLLHKELTKRLKRGMPENQYVLPYSQKEPEKPMTRSMFDKMWRRIKRTIELNGATSHSFRSTYATMMNAHCDHIDPKALQGALRHKTPDLAIKVYTKENTNKTRIAEEEYAEWLSTEMAR